MATDVLLTVLWVPLDVIMVKMGFFSFGITFRTEKLPC